MASNAREATCLSTTVMHIPSRPTIWHQSLCSRCLMPPSAQQEVRISVTNAVASEEEIYTEEYIKLLGSYNEPW